MNFLLRIHFGRGELSFVYAKIGMKGVNVKYGILTLVAFFVFFSKGYSIGDNNQVGARGVALGNASVAIISPFSVFYNQAALALFKNISVAIDYRQPYLLDGFSSKALAFVIPTPLSNFAVGIQQKGIPGYSASVSYTHLTLPTKRI